MKRRTRSAYRGGRTKANSMKVILKLFFKLAARPEDEEKPDSISNTNWASMLEDYQETYDLYMNEPHLMEEKVKSYNAKDNFEYLVEPEDTLLSAEWVNGEFAVELRIKTNQTAAELKQQLLDESIEDYLWYKTESAWNVWTLKNDSHFAFTDYRKPENITVTPVYTAGSRRRRTLKKHK